MTRPVGLTQDAGFQIGVSRTLPLPPSEAWRFLMSPEGLALWLGEGVSLGTDRGAPYATADGTSGETRGYQEGRRIRVTHRPRGAAHTTTVQITVTARSGKAVVGFHQERMANEAERERQRGHWRSVADAVEGALLPGAG